jgi:hypothetical protein
VFNYAIYAVGSRGQPVPMLPGQQDLVFSIVFESGAADFNLQLIELHIPLGPPAPLMENYNGAGATMLSNLRFNVIAQFNADDELVLTLKPRSTNGFVAVSKINELSFLLSGVVVKTFDAPTTIEVDKWETYQNRAPFYKTVFVTLAPVT